MRVLLVSRVWPTDERSGVSLCAGTHARMILAMGHDLALVGSVNVERKDLGVRARSYFVRASGGMSLYSPPRVSIRSVFKVLEEESPDLLVLEGWQTALTEAFAWCAARQGRRILMISHGVAVAPFSKGFLDRCRSVAWWPYRRLWLPKMIKRMTWLTTLDAVSTSERFLDRDIARRGGTPVTVLANAPVNWDESRKPRNLREFKVICIGYFSPIKNQLAIVRLADALRNEGVLFEFIGNRSGDYYKRCVAEVERRGLEGLVSFRDDTTLALGQEIGRCMVVISASLTEALPMVLLEAMASGTPFVAPAVGAVSQLGGGLFADDDGERIAMVRGLLYDATLWARCALDGIALYEERYSDAAIYQSLATAIEGAASR